MPKLNKNEFHQNKSNLQLRTKSYATYYNPISWFTRDFVHKDPYYFNVCLKKKTKKKKHRNPSSFLHLQHKQFAKYPDPRHKSVQFH